MDIMPHHRGGADRAKAEAIDGLYLYPSCSDPRRFLDQRLYSARLARFRATQFDHRKGLRRRVEIMVEAHHAMHLGTGKVELGGNFADHIFAYMAIFGLKIVQ